MQRAHCAWNSNGGGDVRNLAKLSSVTGIFIYDKLKTMHSLIFSDVRDGNYDTPDIPKVAKAHGRLCLSRACSNSANNLLITISLKIK